MAPVGGGVGEFVIMETILNFLRVVWVIFLVLMTFNVLIVVHEWGHFLAARWRGLQVDRFQIWFGKPLWKKTVNGVQYGLGSIPAGGFVALPQMAPMEAIEGKNLNEGEQEEGPRDLPPITPLDKVIVAFAGPLFSFLLAIVFAVAVHFAGLPVDEASSTTVIGYLGPDRPAAESGLKVGDKILSIDGNEVDRFLGMIGSVQWNIASGTSNPIVIKVDRPGEGLKALLVKMPSEEEKAAEEEKKHKPWWKAFVERPELRKIGIGPRITPIIGEVFDPGPGMEAGLKAGDIVEKINGQKIITLSDVNAYQDEHVGEPLTYSVIRGEDKQKLELTVVPRLPVEPSDAKEPEWGIGMDHAGVRGMSYPGIVDQVVKSLLMMKNTLGAIITPKSEVSVSHLSGPVGIMGLYYDLFSMENGWRFVLWFSVIMNVNLAVLNLLPFPVLDGGHIVMATFEWVRRKPVKFRVLEMIQTAFVVLLLGFMIFVTMKDVGDRVNGAGGGGKLRFAPIEGATPPQAPAGNK